MIAFDEGQALLVLRRQGMEYSPAEMGKGAVGSLRSRATTSDGGHCDGEEGDTVGLDRVVYERRRPG